MWFYYFSISCNLHSGTPAGLASVQLELGQDSPLGCLSFSDRTMLHGSHVLLVKRILTTQFITLSVHLKDRTHTAGQLAAINITTS